MTVSWYRLIPECSQCKTSQQLRLLAVDANSDGQIRLVLICENCQTDLTELYVMAGLIKHCATMDLQNRNLVSLQKVLSEKVGDEAFLRSLRIAPFSETN